MVLNTKILNLVGILILVRYDKIKCDPAPFSEETDEDTSLKQALFLVELLKSDFAKVLRGNNILKNNITDDDNSTCPTPIDDFNSTTAVNVTDVTVNGLSTNEASIATPPLKPFSPPFPPGAASQPPFSNWPPMPMSGYPLTGPLQQGNFPADENYRFPYRFGRRRMIPDYYYFDFPPKGHGKFRRLYGNDTADDIANETVATTTSTSTQAQTTTNASSTTIEITTLRIEESAITTLRNEESDITTLRIEESPKTTLPIEETSTSTSNVPTTVTPPTTKPTTTQTRAGVRTPTPLPKARIISNRTEKLKHRSGYDLRQQKSTTEKYTSEDVVMSQVASELINEFGESNTKNTWGFITEVKKKRTTRKQRPMKKLSTTMKIFLKGSSRLPIPLPENNAFCHSYPRNALCGTLL